MAEGKAKFTAEWDKDFEKKIEQKFESWSKDCHPVKSKMNPSAGGGVYFFGFVGALIYFLSNANGFWNGLLGILKAIIWPGFLVYELLKFFQL